MNRQLTLGEIKLAALLTGLRPAFFFCFSLLPLLLPDNGGCSSGHAELSGWDEEELNLSVIESLADPAAGNGLKAGIVFRLAPRF